jgi:hypothetical protein
LHYGCETWTPQVEHERKLDGAETRTVKIMYGVTYVETLFELRKRFGIKDVIGLITRNRHGGFVMLSEKQRTSGSNNIF